MGRAVIEYRCKLVGGDGQHKSMPEPLVVPSKPKLRSARVVSRFRQIRRKRFKLMGIGVLAVVGYFDYYAWKHLAYGSVECGSLGWFRNTCFLVYSGHVFRVDRRRSSHELSRKSNESSLTKSRIEGWIMTSLSTTKKKSVEKVKIDREFRRIVEKNRRRDLELLKWHAKI